MLVLILNRLERLDYLIRSKSTGTPLELAHHLNISERALYDFLNEMRTMGACIKYSKQLHTYYYENGGKFWVGFSEE